jgi:hypothetical protein
MLQRNGYASVGFSGNQILLNGTLQPFEKPPGQNSDLFANVGAAGVNSAQPSYESVMRTATGRRGRLSASR